MFKSNQWAVYIKLNAVYLKLSAVYINYISIKLKKKIQISIKDKSKYVKY